MYMFCADILFHFSQFKLSDQPVNCELLVRLLCLRVGSSGDPVPAENLYLMFVLLISLYQLVRFSSTEDPVPNQQVLVPCTNWLGFLLLKTLYQQVLVP